MKKNLIFCILSLIFLLPIPAEAVKRMTANPVNIASRLVLKQDSATVASILEYYGYTAVTHTVPSADTATQSQTQQAPLTDTDGFAVFSHPDGSIIRFAYLNPDPKQAYPTIHVYTKSTKPQIEKILSELDYKKAGNHYEATISKYSTYLTKCTFGPGKYLTFDRKKKQ